MFTDMVGFSALTQSNESLAIEVLTKHNEVVRPILHSFKGREVKTIGDSFLVEFESALDAVRCAYEIQTILRIHNLTAGPERRMTLRIGIHLGDVIHEGKDIFGDAVNIASRIEPLAEPEGICVSSQIHDQVINKFEHRMVSLGERSLKNISSPVIVYKMEMPWEGSQTADLDRRRIAVLPFVSISPDPNDEYFADGLTEELIGRLSVIKGVEVIARTSVMSFKKQNKTASQIGRELHVGTLLEGSVRKAGNRIRVSAQLIDSGSEGHLWMENYDRNLEDIFGVQTEVAERVASSLEVKLTEKNRRMMQRETSTSPEAYSLYLKGRYYWNIRSKEAVLKAIEYFRLAVDQDPSFAAGYSGLAMCHLVLGRNQMADPNEEFPKAKEYTKKALELDPDLAEALACLANSMHYYDFEPKGAVKQYRRAIGLNPSYATAHQWLAHSLVQLGDLEEGHSEIMKAKDLDPLSRIINLNVGDSLFYQKRYDEALVQFSKLKEMDPNFTFLYPSLAELYQWLGRYDEALETADTFERLSKRPLESNLIRSRIYATMGNRTESSRLLSEVEAHYKKEAVSPLKIGAVYSILGEIERCFEWMNRAYHERDPMVMVIKIEPELDRVRHDPRFLALLENVGLADGS
jgi:adenylate cyclase